MKSGLLFVPLGAALMFCLSSCPARAHSGKARFHAIVDTDGAPDDLRTLCMLLGNREVEVLAVVTSEGALPPAETAQRVAALLGEFRHEGIPVGAGRAAGGPAPAWRMHARAVDWGDTTFAGDRFPAAAEVAARALANEEEPVVYLALGALTNLADLSDAAPSLAGRIDRVIWYDDSTDALPGANFRADSAAARRVLTLGLRVDVVAADPERPVRVTQPLLDSVAAVPTPYARKIAAAYRREPLAGTVGSRHAELWDDLTVVRLFAPDLFACRDAGGGVRICTLADGEAVRQVPRTILAVLRGRTDSESRVFYGFPLEESCYAADVVPVIGEAVARHGASEWRAGVLTNELHGHLGIYATVGVKMGIRAREWFAIGVDDLHVTSLAGSQPPVSCMNDGLQVAAGATVGHGLFTVEEVAAPRPEALFRFRGRTIRLTLKPEYARRIRDDVQRGIELYGGLTEAYWQYVRALALRYWVEFDRHEMFDLRVEP